MSKYKETEGQCGTCKFAAGFDYGPSPSGPEDGVHCTSEENAKLLDEHLEGNRCQEELARYGYIDLFRLEVLADEHYKCPNWQPKE